MEREGQVSCSRGSLAPSAPEHKHPRGYDRPSGQAQELLLDGVTTRPHLKVARLELTPFANGVAVDPPPASASPPLLIDAPRSRPPVWLRHFTRCIHPRNRNRESSSSSSSPCSSSDPFLRASKSPLSSSSSLPRPVGPAPPGFLCLCCPAAGEGAAARSSLALLALGGGCLSDLSHEGCIISTATAAAAAVAADVTAVCVNGGRPAGVFALVVVVEVVVSD